MTRTFSVAGTLAVLLLAFWLLRIAGGTGREAPPRLPPSAAAGAAIPAPAALAPSDPAAQAVDDLAAWPIATASGR